MNDESAANIDDRRHQLSFNQTPLPATGEHDLLGDVCTPERKANLETLRRVLILAVELAREGGEGRKIGTIFVVSDTKKTSKRSKYLILDPLWYHPDSKKRVHDPDLQETVKELAQLDGAFIVSDEGIVLSACRYINASSKNIDLPLGLGSRHMAAASITRETDAIAIVVSESAVVRVFDDGEIVSEIIPELWLLKRYGVHLSGGLLSAPAGAYDDSQQGGIW